MARILLIDDDDQVAELFRECLEGDGHQVERAAAAYGALLRAQRAPFDLVVMDLLLQGANGVVASLALRGIGFAGPIIVVTGGLLPVDEALYDRVNFAGRLLKPVRLSELSEEVARQLEGDG